MADQERPRGRREGRSRRRQQREQEEAKRRRRYMIGGGVIAFVLIFIGVLTAIELIGDDDEVEDPFPPVQTADGTHENVASEPYFLGDPDAPVHLIEWSDYQ